MPQGRIAKRLSGATMGEDSRLGTIRFHHRQGRHPSWLRPVLPAPGIWLSTTRGLWRNCPYEALTVRGPGQARYVFNTLTELYSVLPKVYDLALTLPEGPLEDFRAAVRDLPRTTEAERLVVQRVGQDIFRDRLMTYWKGRCPLTGIAEPELAPCLAYRSMEGLSRRRGTTERPQWTAAVRLVGRCLRPWAGDFRRRWPAGIFGSIKCASKIRVALARTDSLDPTAS